MSSQENMEPRSQCSYTDSEKVQSQARRDVFWVEAGQSQGTRQLDWSDRDKEREDSVQLVWPSTNHILNGECNHIRELHGHHEALLRAPHSKQTAHKELIHVWAIWKAWCRMIHDNENKTTDTFVTLYREFVNQELARAN